MTRMILFGLIILATVIFSTAYMSLQTYTFAASVFAFGVLWLVLHIMNKAVLDSIFFVLFMGFAISGCLQNFSIPLMLLGAAASIAAWDLARLQPRLQQITDKEVKGVLEINHLQKLGVVSIAGLALSLIPLFVRFSINFVIFVFILILLMLILRQSVLFLRAEPSEKHG